MRLKFSLVHGRVSEWTCGLRSQVGDGEGVCWEALLMPPMLAAGVGHITICENGLNFIWNCPGQEVSFFTTELKLPPPDKGQRFYHWTNDEIIVSIFAYLSLSYQDFSPVSQHNPGIWWGGREWSDNVIADTYFSRGTSGVGTGVYILL